ncbi:MAG: cysteine-rich CWC family protein [Bacteroidota bacterium]
MCRHEQKYCPRCNDRFECKAGSILICQCINVALSEDERNYMQEKFCDCLCGNCLKEIKAEYHRQLFKEKLRKISSILQNKKK